MKKYILAIAAAAALVVGLSASAQAAPPPPAAAVGFIYNVSYFPDATNTYYVVNNGSQPTTFSTEIIRAGAVVATDTTPVLNYHESWMITQTPRVADGAYGPQNQAAVSETVRVLNSDGVLVLTGHPESFDISGKQLIDIVTGKLSGNSRPYIPTAGPGPVPHVASTVGPAPHVPPSGGFWNLPYDPCALNEFSLATNGAWATGQNKWWITNHGTVGGPNPRAYTAVYSVPDASGHLVVVATQDMTPLAAVLTYGATSPLPEQGKGEVLQVIPTAGYSTVGCAALTGPSITASKK